MSKPTNPPAFPGKAIQWKRNDVVQICEGMTLRDYFAAKAMQGDLSALQIDARRFSLLMGICDIEKITMAAAIAREAFVQADAMLEERAKQ